MTSPRRLPISARHAFALAFDLAARRDALHSLVVPFLIRAPWIVVPAAIAMFMPGLRPEQQMLIRAAGELLDFLAFVVLTSMLRFRARSVFKTDATSRVAPAAECYSLGLRRAPALYLTEALRNAAFTLTLPLVFPFLWVAFKFSFATEAVVVRGLNPAKSFSRSFQLTEGRFERWLEMIVITVLLVVPFWFLMTLGYLTTGGGAFDLWYALGKLLTAALIPIVQYAWTFFYLRLEYIEAASFPPAAELAAAAAAAPAAPNRTPSLNQPQLRLVERDPAERDERLTPEP